MKITKKEYQARKQIILNSIESLQTALNSIPLDIEGLSQDTINFLGDSWNATYDKIEDLKKELHFLDDEWDKRNWNIQDYYQHSLITSNID